MCISVSLCREANSSEDERTLTSYFGNVFHKYANFHRLLSSESATVGSVGILPLKQQAQGFLLGSTELISSVSHSLM